ncbi:MAG: hypothetical protein ACRYGL_13120, partial [Janthinobacterium lividum]
MATSWGMARLAGRMIAGQISPFQFFHHSRFIRQRPIEPGVSLDEDVPGREKGFFSQPATCRRITFTNIDDRSGGLLYHLTSGVRMVIRIPFPLQRFATRSTNFREPAPVASAALPPWRREIDRIGTAFKRLHRAAGRLQARHPQSALSLELGDLEKKLEKVQKKISTGFLGGLVGNGPLARCFATRREHARNVTRILAALADAATLVAADLDAVAQGGADTLDGAALTHLREKQRAIFRGLEEVKGCMPKEQTRFRLRTLAIVATAVVSIAGAIVGATLVAPILVIPLTVTAVGLAINATLHFTQRRDTGWKALTQLIDQFTTSSRDLDYDALH